MPHRRERQRFPFVSLAVCVQHVLARSISISSGRDCMRVCSCVYATNNMRRCIDSILWQICKKKAQKSMCKAHKCEINRIRCSSRSGKGFKDSTTHTRTHTQTYKCVSLWQQLHKTAAFQKWTKSQIPLASSVCLCSSKCCLHFSANRKLLTGKAKKIVAYFRAQHSIRACFSLCESVAYFRAPLYLAACSCQQNHCLLMRALHQNSLELIY